MLITVGLLFITIIVLSFTTLPFWMYYDLGVSETKLKTEPEYIVVMGGGGIPSESGLMRTYMASKVASQYKEAKIIIAMPGNVKDTNSSVYMMKKEMVLRGINGSRISFEYKGTNTRSQALGVQKIIDETKPTLIVTSPEHMYRSIRAFQKVGFTNVSGEAAFHRPLEASFLYKDDELGGNTMLPNVGKSVQLRYQFWGHMKLQIIVYREYCAIAFYKIKGWI